MALALSHPEATSRRKAYHLHQARAHGGRPRGSRLRPWLIGMLSVVAFAFSAAYVLATGYLFFRDDLIGASLAQQARLRASYEDRIAELRSQIDRITSRQLLDQEAIDAELQRLVGRQAALDARQDMLTGLTAAAREAGLIPEATPPVPLPNPLRPDNLAVGGPDVPVGDFDELMLRGPDETAIPAPAPAEDDIALVEQSLDQLETSQLAFVHAVNDQLSQTTTKIADILETLGLEDEWQASVPGGVGGPYVPVSQSRSFEAFSGGIASITGRLDQLVAIREFARSLPILRPIPDTEITSGFGTRRDPFLGRLSMHEGTDFRGQTGTSVRSTAGGTVTVAETTGGYGRMVEIDHGNGISTRYAHLSRIMVSEGQVLPAGALIGQVGSTGRSTGPHLHYEIRIDGRPIDPMRYLRIGPELIALL